jgi:methylenetetrahydrofolate dehydrogenase (NADP+)/methenyltetrahydrofolate cyclohydrolase
MESPTILRGGIIDGKAAAAEVRAEVRAEVEALGRLGVVPRVVFVRAGDDPASQVYVAAKAKACAEVGIRSELVYLPEDVSEAELEARVRALNGDEDVDAVLVQLPLPRSIQSKRVLDLIEPCKDVDGFHAENLGSLLLGAGRLAPCTPAGVMRMLQMLGVELRGKRAVVVGRSVIVGKPMAALLIQKDATVTVCNRHTPDLARLVGEADVLVVAVGSAGLVKGSWVKPGAWVFDVGITRGADGKLKGDVELEGALGRAAGITPVPGGVGPMTIAMLLSNAVRCAKLRRGLVPREIERA